MRPKCLILLVAAAAMVVISPSLSAAKSNKHCGPFLIDASTPVAVSTTYRGVQDVSDPTGRRGDEITFVVNTTSPSFAFEIGPNIGDFTFELSDASGTIRPSQELGQPPYTSWPESLNYMKLQLVSKNSNLLNGTFELGPSGSPVDGTQFDLCSSVSGYRIRGSKPYRNATESTAGTDLAPGDDRTRSGSNIKKRGHFPVTVTVTVGFTGEGGSEEEVTVTAPKLFAFPGHGRTKRILFMERDIINNSGPECRSGNLAVASWQAAWEEFGMDISPTAYRG